MELGGLHHVTAVTSDASMNVAFYTRILGMRLVKKTVNQDDVSAYHLFYGDETGRAGSEMTFFDWSQAGRNRPGVGTISATAMRVTGDDTLRWWAARLDSYSVSHSEIVERNGVSVLAFTDPEGQALELIQDSQVGGAPPSVPWSKSPVDSRYGIRGLEGVSLTVRELQPTAAVLTQVLGFRQVHDYHENGYRAVVFEVGPGGPGTEVRIIERPDLPFRRQVGAGGVHHVAFRTPDSEEHRAWRERIAGAGLGVTEPIDRFYFKSIYFREPGGILFEIATDGPGFSTDEDVEHLGESLALPPFLEPRRSEIEAHLQPISPVEFARAKL